MRLRVVRRRAVEFRRRSGPIADKTRGRRRSGPWRAAGSVRTSITRKRYFACRGVRPSILGAMLHLPCSIIIDADLIAYDEQGRPDPGGLERGANANLCVWCFDLLTLHGHDLRAQPLVRRKERLLRIIETAGDSRVRYSEHYDDARLLQAAGNAGGIISKRTGAPYRPGRSGD